jgi:WD40 repeat protein/serine/threonine protein kinase
VPTVPDDPRVLRAVEEYLEEVRAGRRPGRSEFLARHADVAGPLAECLDGLEFIQAAAPQLKEGAEPCVPDAGPSSQPGPGEPLGDFRIVREVGRGGMGVVYEAVQLSLGRRVALKVLPFATALDARQVRRFKTEAQAAAQLHHTHIVPVFGVGCERGVHYYAMQFVEGRTLAEAVRQWRQEGAGPVPATVSGLTGPCVPAPDAAPAGGATTAPAAARSTERSARGAAHFRMVAGLGVQAAEALEHAHQMGVIHRDVKPGNLLVEPDGHLWVSDFGLAHVQGEAGLTMTGDLVGTLRYMSPEQALAKRVVVDHRTDVYSLGVTLYELLTLEPAFNGRDRREVLRQIAFEEPRPPRRLDRAVPADLETIVLKAMAKAPAERYGTCQELADDLRRWLDDRPIRARRPTVIQRVRRWSRRHRAVVTAVAVCLALALVLAAVGFAAANAVLRRQHGETLDALQREARTSYGHRVALAHRAWLSGDQLRAGHLLAECPPELRNWEWHHVHRLCHSESLDLREGDAPVNAVAFSADGKYLASVGGGVVRVHDTADGHEVFRRVGQNSVAFSPAGPHLASAAGTAVHVVQVPSGREVSRLEEPVGDVYAVAYSPDGRRLAWGGKDGAVVRDAAGGGRALQLVGHAGGVVGVAFSPAGDRLATAGRDRAVKVWDAEGKERRTLRGLEGDIDSVAFSPDGARLAAAGQGRTVKVWDVRSGALLLTIPGRPWNIFHLPVGIRSVVFSPDGQSLAVAGGDRIVHVFDAATGQETLALRGHTRPVRSVAFSPDGKRLASAGEDHAVKVWDVTRPPEALSFRVDRRGANRLAFSADGRWCATGGRGGVELCELEGGGVVRVPCEANCLYRNLAFGRDGRSLAAAAEDGSVQLLDVSEARGRSVLAGNMHHVFQAAFSAGLRRVARASEGEVRVAELAGGDEVVLPRPAGGRVGVMAFAPGEDHLALADDAGCVEVWDVVGRQELLCLNCSAAPVFSLAFSADGQRLAGLGRDIHGNAPDRVTVWDARTGATLMSLRGPTPVGRSTPLGSRCACFSPDGRRLAVAGEEVITLRDAETGQELLELRGHVHDVRFLAYSDDGRRLLSASEDGEVRV